VLCGLGNIPGLQQNCINGVTNSITCMKLIQESLANANVKRATAVHV